MVTRIFQGEVQIVPETGETDNHTGAFELCFKDGTSIWVGGVTDEDTVKLCKITEA